MRYTELIKKIEEIAPLENIPPWDNSGVQICTGREYIDRVLLCLEINREVISEAKAKDVQMIITHHPLIFGGLNSVDRNEPVGEYILDLAENKISVYSAHLSFDNAPGGNNMYLAKLLGLTDVSIPGKNEKTAQPEGGDSAKKNSYSYDPDNPGSIGFLPQKMTVNEAVSHVERCLNLPCGYVRIVNSGQKNLSKTGFCTGAGGDFMKTAVKEGCDLFITGDVKLHEAQYAKAAGMSVIDAGHYGTEKIFSENFAKQLREITEGETEIIEAQSDTNPYTL